MKKKVKPAKFKQLDARALEILEQRLSFDDIRFFRSLAEMALKEEMAIAKAKGKKEGWFSGACSFVCVCNNVMSCTRMCIYTHTITCSLVHLVTH